LCVDARRRGAGAAPRSPADREAAVRAARPGAGRGPGGACGVEVEECIGAGCTALRVETGRQVMRSVWMLAVAATVALGDGARAAQSQGVHAKRKGAGPKT